MIGFDADEQQTYLYMPRCKKWSCYYCGQVNRSQWAHRVYEGVEWYRLLGKTRWAFVTVTAHEKNRGFVRGMFNFQVGWSQLYQKMRNGLGSFRYVYVPELHKDGSVHVHIIMSAIPDQRWLKNTARSCGLGYMDESERLRDSAKAAWYVSKYLTKSLDWNDWPTKVRRIRTSTKWPEVENPLQADHADIHWMLYKTEWPADGLDWLADGLKSRNGKPVQVIGKQ